MATALRGREIAQVFEGPLDLERERFVQDAAASAPEVLSDGCDQDAALGQYGRRGLANLVHGWTLLD